jgi:hypothetical protein
VAIHVFSLSVVGVGCLALGNAGAQEAEPFHVRNLNPLVAIFGLPAWDTVEMGTTLGVTTEVANHYRLSRRVDDLLILDGETLRTTLAFTHGFRDRWSFGVEMPYYRISDGVLDDLVDVWHSAFGLPDGGRNNRPEDQLQFQVGDRNGTFFRFDDPQSGFGDLELKVARRIGAAERFVAQVIVKLPTGDEDMLAGSGSADWSLTLLRSSPITFRNRAAGLFWGVGLLRVGEPDRIDFRAENLVTTAVLGAGIQLFPKFGLKAQLDYHSPFFDTPLEEIGEGAIQASFGTWLTPGERAVVEIAIVEDLEVSTSPDVVLQLAARWSW